MDQPPPPDSPPPPREPKRPGDFDLSFISSAKAGMAAVRRSFSSILGTSDADIVRRATTGYADDALLKTDGTGQRVSASTWVDRATRAHLAPFQREFDAAFSEWVKKRGIRLWQRSAERKRFDDMASMAILQPDLYTDPTIVRVANAVRHTLRETLLTAKRHGANGFDHIEPRDDYFPRILRHLALNQATRIHGDDAVHRLIERALADGGAFEPEDIPAIARAYIKTWRDLDRWVDSDKAALHDGRPDILREVLAGEGWSAEKLDNVIGSVFTERDSQAGVTARAKRRTILDETAEVETPAGTLRFSELLDRNVERVVPTYVRQVLGAAAAAEVYRAVGGEDVRTWSQLRGRMGRQMNGIRIDAETIERDLKMMETLDRHVRGLPLESHNIASRTMARLRGYNYIRLSGQFGFAQLPEAVAMVGETGFRTMLAQLPALRQVFSTAADGKLANPLLRTIEQVWGLGTDRLLHRFHDRLDDLEGSFDRTVARGDEWLFRAKRLAGDVSGMAAINMASQRMAAAGAIQKWHDDAKSNRIPSTRRLASMGMSEADARRVIKAMREEIDAQRGVRTVTGPLLGRRVEDIDFSKWTDQNAAAILVDAVDKWAKRVIQTNDIGNMHPWMVKDWGRLITQFRSFTLVAWEKQLLHRVQMRDWEAFASASLGMLGAGLVYMGQTYTQSIGLPEEERKRFLKDRLSTGSIAAASFQRGAFSSLLPAFIDQVLPIAGEDPIFNFRQTGLSTPLFSLDSSPSIQLVTKDPWRALRGLTSAVRDDRVVDRNDVMAAANLLPFQQVIGIRNMLRAFAARFPENDR